MRSGIRRKTGSSRMPPTVTTMTSMKFRPIRSTSSALKTPARACEGKGRDGLIFGDGAPHLKGPHSVTGWFVAAVTRSQALDSSFLTITSHDLRHTAASLAISAGANPKAVQRMLGHASAAMTLDTYADLFEHDLDNASERLDAARAQTVVGFSWGLEGLDNEKAP